RHSRLLIRLPTVALWVANSIVRLPTIEEPPHPAMVPLASTNASDVTFRWLRDTAFSGTPGPDHDLARAAALPPPSPVGLVLVRPLSAAHSWQRAKFARS